MRLIFNILFWGVIALGIGTFFLNTNTGSGMLENFLRYVKIKDVEKDAARKHEAASKRTMGDKIDDINRSYREYMDAVNDKMSFQRAARTSREDFLEDYDRLMEKFREDMESQRLAAELWPTPRNIANIWRELQDRRDQGGDLSLANLPGRGDVGQQLRDLVDKARELSSGLRDATGAAEEKYDASLRRMERLAEQQDKLRQMISYQEEKARRASEKIREAVEKNSAKNREQMEKNREKIDRWKETAQEESAKNREQMEKGREKIDRMRGHFDVQRERLNDRAEAQREKLRTQMDRLRNR